MTDNVQLSDLGTAIECARTQLGFSELKDKQLEAISTFVGGRDTFVILPTGYGKSVIFSLLPLVYDQLKGLLYEPTIVFLAVYTVLYVCTCMQAALVALLSASAL